MLRGRFGDTSGRPYLEGTIVLPRLGLQGPVSFIVDTGADESLLMPTDSKRMGIDFSRLEGDQECGGVGGTVHCFTEHAYLVFSDGQDLFGYEIELTIYPDDADMSECPTLLGRDVLDRWRMVSDPSKRVLTFDPRSWDLRMPISGGA